MKVATTDSHLRGWAYEFIKCHPGILVLRASACDLAEFVRMVSHDYFDHMREMVERRPRNHALFGRLVAEIAATPFGSAPTALSMMRCLREHRDIPTLTGSGEDILMALVATGVLAEVAELVFNGKVAVPTAQAA